MSIIKTMFTGADNESHDVGRYISVASVLTALGLQIYVVVAKDQSFDIQTFGTGFGILVTGLGAMLKLKETTEPLQTIYTQPVVTDK